MIVTKRQYDLAAVRFWMFSVISMVYTAEKWEASQIHVIFFKQDVGGTHMLIPSESTSTLLSEQLAIYLKNIYDNKG